MIFRTALRPLAAPMAMLYALGLALAIVLALGSTPAHAQELPEDPGGLLPVPDEPAPDEPAPDEPAPDEPAPDEGFEEEPQVTEIPEGGVATGAGGPDDGASATPLLVLGAMTLAGAGALLARRRATVPPTHER